MLLRRLRFLSSSAAPANVSALISQLNAEASQGVKNADLIQSVTAAVTANADSLSAEQCAKLAWSLAWLNEKNADLFTLLADKAKTKAANMDTTSLVQLSWAFASADLLRTPAVRSFFQVATPALKQEQEKEHRPEHFLPLLYTCVAWTQNHPQPGVAMLPPLLLALTGGGDLSQHTPQVLLSPQDAGSTQEEICWAFRNLVADEAVTQDVMTNIDISADIVWPIRSVVLDVVNLEEDLLQGGKELNGMAALKQRLLRNAGWEVHTIKQHAYEQKFGSVRNRNNIEDKKKWLAEHWWPPKA